MKTSGCVARCVGELVILAHLDRRIVVHHHARRQIWERSLDLTALLRPKVLETTEPDKKATPSKHN